MMDDALLVLTGVTRRFLVGDKSVMVLRNIDLAIRSGEFIAIRGVSGSGKTTLLNILGALDQPSSGSYKFSGRETCSLSSDELACLRREYFGFIFQRYHLLAHLSAVDNVEVPAIYSGVPPPQRRTRAAQLLARLGMADRADHRPSQLSGGQQQRVSIARALMNGGKVILADEPTGALDSKSGEEVLRILFELHAQGHTVVIVTHDEKVAARAHRIIEIRDGEIIRDQAHPHQCDRLHASPPSQMAGPDASRSAARFGGFIEMLRLAWIALLSHRLRTVLTMLGIVIGIASVVSIIAIGEGARRYVLKEVGSVGTHTIDIYPGQDWGDSQASAIETLVSADANALRVQPYVDSVTPEISRSLLLRFRDVDVTALVNGVGERYFQVRGMTTATGIAFSSDEVRRQNQVVVIDQNTRRKLFGAATDPLGKVILINSLPCVVIGVAAERKGAFSSGKDLNVWMPYTTASSRLFGQRHLSRLTVRVRDGLSSQAAEQSIIKLLTQRHGRKDFFTDNSVNIVKIVEKTGRSLTLLLSLIGVISLVVGGIGVMNIMLVSVTERTHEIGIRMAVGARQIDIMRQFLVEAVMVCLLGGVIGIVMSFGMRGVFSMFVDQWQMVFSVESIALAFLCSTLVGIVFGFLPARNASRLNPIHALVRD